MSEPSHDPTKPPTLNVALNGPFHSICEVLRTVMVPTAEAKIGALFSNMWKGEEFCPVLMEMGHPQPPTPVITNNSTVCGIINSMARWCHTCAVDMRFYWVWDQ
eukprot:11385518-Ditylum_brightwellii.AAC.1